VSVVLNDVPANDWNFLFRKVANLYPANVFLSAVSASFYTQIVPNATVSFGIATSSFHWLSGAPCKLGNNIFCHLSLDSLEKETWKNHAKKDWDTLLRLRSLELKTGALLVVTAPCWADDGHVLRHIFGLLNQAFQTLTNQGILHQDHYKGVNMLVYFRNKEEYCTISEDIPLQLVHCEVYQEALPIYKTYQAHHSLDKFCDDMVKFIKTVYDGLFRDQLLSQNVAVTEVEHIMAELWKSYYSLLGANVSNFSTEGCYAIVVFKKNK